MIAWPKILKEIVEVHLLKFHVFVTQRKCHILSVNFSRERDGFLPDFKHPSYPFAQNYFLNALVFIISIIFLTLIFV